MGGRSTRPGGHHQTPSRVVVTHSPSLLRVPEWVPGRKVYPVGLSGSGQVKSGDLVRYSNPGRIPRPMMGIIIDGRNGLLAYDLKFFRVFLEDGEIKLITSCFLESL